MKPSEIPTKREAWNKNYNGYLKHQLRLRELAQWCDDHGLHWEIPADRGEWDRGVDIIIQGMKIDLKTFGLQQHLNSWTWDSFYYKGRDVPMYEESETAAFLHVTGDDVGEWKLGFVTGLRKSMFYDAAPYYRKRSVMDFDEVAHDLLCATF